jgi:hypothetical protein
MILHQPYGSIKSLEERFSPAPGRDFEARHQRRFTAPSKILRVVLFESLAGLPLGWQVREAITG